MQLLDVVHAPLEDYIDSDGCAAFFVVLIAIVMLVIAVVFILKLRKEGFRKGVIDTEEIDEI